LATVSKPAGTEAAGAAADAKEIKRTGNTKGTEEQKKNTTEEEGLGRPYRPPQAIGVRRNI
jgi:hypothetical protein